MKDVVVDHEKLKAIVADKFKKVDVSSDDADIIADVLTHADLRNVSSHGVLRTERYISHLLNKGINNNPDIKIESTGLVSVKADGDNGMGQVTFKKAAEEAIRMSQDKGVGIAGVINSEHCGALSYFVEMAAENDMIGIAMTNANKLVVPFGGADPFFGTNPMAFGFPAEVHSPIILDMATSNVAFGKILHARETKEKIPESWGLDKNGEPTDDPEQVSVLQPIAGPKGYGLGLVVDVLSGILTNSPFGLQIAPFQSFEVPRSLGHFFMALNPEILTSKNLFKKQIDDLIDELHQQRTAKHFDSVLVPGEPEQITKDRRLKEGIPVPESIYEYLISSRL